MKLDQNIIEEFEKNGAVCIRNAFDQSWIDLARVGIEKNLSSPSQFGEKLKGDKLDGCYFDDYCNWTRIDEFKTFAFDSPAAEIAGILTKSKDIAFYHEHVLVKEPGTDKRTPWHHDQSYYPIDGEKVCSIWMPVDPVGKDTCVQFVSGSHKWGWFHPIKFETSLPYEIEHDSLSNKNFQPVPDIEGNKDQYEILHWNLQPGDCIVFHMKCLHGAPGNLHTTMSRRVLSTRWLGDDAVLASRPWTVSPPTYGGLQIGNRALSSEFPLAWKNRSLL